MSGGTTNVDASIQRPKVTEWFGENDVTRSCSQPEGVFGVMALHHHHQTSNEWISFRRIDFRDLENKWLFASKPFERLMVEDHLRRNFMQMVFFNVSLICISFWVLIPRISFVSQCLSLGVSHFVTISPSQWGNRMSETQTLRSQPPLFPDFVRYLTFYLFTPL